MLRGATGQSHTPVEHEEVSAMALEEKVRVAAPDGLVAEVDGVTGRRYKATGGGMYDMHPRDAKALLREGGFVPSVGGVTRGGYECACGFRPVVRTCSRCGGRAETAAERAERLAAGIPMVFDVNLRTGDIREVGPMPIAVRPQDLAPTARAIVFGTDEQRDAAIARRVLRYVDRLSQMRQS